jgi:hypothetical protein
VCPFWGVVLRDIAMPIVMFFTNSDPTHRDQHFSIS